MNAPIAHRRPETVRELEALQQQERAGAGDAPLTVDGVIRLLQEDIHRELIAARLDSGGLSAVVDGAADDDERAKDRAASLVQAWRLDDETQWSRYESPGIRWGIADVCARIEPVFANRGWHLAEPPIVGTLATGQVSAATQKSSHGAPLVLIDNGFFKFAGAISQLAVFASHDARSSGSFSNASLQLMADLAATQTVLNTCLYLFKRATPPQVASQVTQIVQAVVTFVIAHEYAHVAAGDLDAHPLSGAIEAAARRAKEFEADQRAFITSVESAQEPEMGVFGPFVYFAGLDAMDRAAAAYAGRAASPESGSDAAYPTPFERTVALLKWIETTPYVSQLRSAIAAASRCYHIVLFTWDQILPSFWAAREEMSAFDPAKRGSVSSLPDADALGVVAVLWQHVQASGRRTQ